MTLISKGQPSSDPVDSTCSFVVSFLFMQIFLSFFIIPIELWAVALIIELYNNGTLSSCLYPFVFGVHDTAKHRACNGDSQQ